MLKLFFISITVPIALFATCCGDDEPDEQPDGSADTDTDTDTDTDADTDTDTDTDTDSDAGADASALCVDGADIMQPSPDGGAEISTGVELCADESKHRYAAIGCSNSALDDSDCIEDAYCDSGQLLCDTGFSDALCVTPCASDADCADGEACLCDEGNQGTTRCIAAECRTDADCGGTECGVSTDDCALENRLACRTADDECHGSTDCADEYGFDLCVDLGEAWGCLEGMDCE